MKKLLLYTGIFISILTFSHAGIKESQIQKSLHDSLMHDRKNWEKTKEESGFQEFTCSENFKETITISLETREHDPYLMKSYHEGPTDILSLMSHEDLSSLQRMKELRIESKKISSPYSVWKLLYVFHKDDIIYECEVPSIGPYSYSYAMTRLIKTEHGYLKITYQSLEEISKEDSLYWLERLKQLS